MAKRRRTEIARITKPAARLVTYSKRRKGLFKKASELCRLCGARAAVVVFSPAGKPDSFGDPSADDIISDYLRDGDGDGDVMPSMDLTQWADWVETEWAACANEEDLESLILKYEAVRDCAREKLKVLEDKSQVNIGAGAPHIPTEEEIDLLFESLGRCPPLSDLLGDGDLMPQEVESKGCGSNAAGGGSSTVASTPASSDLEDCGFDPDEYLNPWEDSAIVGGNSEGEPALSDPEIYGYDPNIFAALEDLGVLR